LALASSCAGHTPAPHAAAASQPAGFYEPAPGQCAPAIDGVCLGWPGLQALLLEQSRREHAWQVALIDADERAQVAEAQRAAAERVAAQHAWWSTWGWPLVLGAAVLGAGGGAVLGAQLRR